MSFSTDFPAAKRGQKTLHLFFEPIASLTPPQNTPTRPHTHTRYHTAVSRNSADAGLAITAAVACLCESAWRTPSFAPQQCVSHTTAAARVFDAVLPKTAMPAVALAALGCVQRHERSFGAFRLSSTPPTRLEEGSSRAKHALLAKNARSTELPSDFRMLYTAVPRTHRL